MNFFPICSIESKSVALFKIINMILHTDLSKYGFLQLKKDREELISQINELQSLLDDFNWAQSEYYFTSISCPLGIVNSDVNPIWNPDIAKFTKRVMSLGIDVELAVIGRDQTILTNQQTRIRTQPTVDMLLKQLSDIIDPTFLSYELLYLYKRDYLKSLRLNIPVAWDDDRVNSILADDANIKYIHSIEYNKLDNGNKLGITFKNRP